MSKKFKNMIAFFSNVLKLILRFMDFYKWFFLEEGRTPEGLFSFWHIFSVTITLALFAFIAVYFAKKIKGEKGRNIFIGVMALSIVMTQVTKFVYLWAPWEVENLTFARFWDVFIGNLPMYLCDMQLYVIPLAFFTRGRFRNWCFDFISIWGILMGVFGTYFAGNLYPSHCVISWSVINSLLNHSISFCTGIFIFVAGLNTMEKRNIPYVISFLVVFMTTALIIDYVDNHNFMFFFHGDGTPFDFFLNLVGRNLVLYQITIYILQCGYMGLFYLVYYLIKKQVDKKKTAKLETENQAL